MIKLLLTLFIATGLVSLTRNALCADSGVVTGRKLSLLISVQETRNPKLRRLWFCDDDINELAALLPTLGYIPSDTTVLTQRSALLQNAKHLNPSRANIRAEIKRLCKEARPEDTILIAFSGHGVQLKRDGRIYLLPSEGLITDTSTLVAVDDVLKELGEQCKAQTKLLLLDACRDDPSDRRPNVVGKISELRIPPNTAVFFGCSRGQGSFETGKLMHSVFYYHVLDGLKGEARDVAGELTLTALEDHLAREVPVTMARHRIDPRTSQSPEYFSTLRSNVTLGKAPGLKPLPIKGVGALNDLAATAHLELAVAYNKTNPDTSIAYKRGGYIGLKALESGTAHFVTTTEKLNSSDVVQIPSVSTSVALIYRLPGMPSLTLNGSVLSDIYLGRVHSWNDPKIAALNPGMVLPDLHIVAVTQTNSPAAGIFTDFLAQFGKEWQHPPKAAKWPIGAPGVDNDGVVRIVTGVEGAIGFVDLTFIHDKKLIKNSAGAKTISMAAVVATDNVPSLIRGQTYIYLKRDLTYLGDRSRALAVLKYLDWCVSTSMTTAPTIYGMLNAERSAEASALLKTIVFDGKPLLD